MEPVRIVIIGATGDLAKKKLFKAFFDLYTAGSLPKDLDIIGAARSAHTDESFRQFAAQSIGEGESQTAFLSHLRYCQGDYASNEGYAGLAALLGKSPRCTHTLFYLAVSPDLYAPMFESLSASGLSIPCVTENGKSSWVRIAVEKPFGRDMETAQRLEDILCKSFAEEQIFRIDHYLAKENLENILAFRFANAIFESLWHHVHVESVHARLFEPFGIDGRGSFYDDFGALRDVGQNHLLQMLTLIAMERPERFDADSIRHARETVLASMMLDDVTPPVRGQYIGYQEEQGVRQDSQTETYFKVTAKIATPRWEGVPFILEAGKKMNTHRVDITVRFKPSLSGFAAKDDMPNEIVFSISPKETIAIKFLAKKRGYGFSLEPRTLSFMYDDGSPDKPKDAYEKLLYDAIVGNRTLFLSNTEIAHSWRFIKEVMDRWSFQSLQHYSEGADGPEHKVA